MTGLLKGFASDDKCDYRDWGNYSWGLIAGVGVWGGIRVQKGEGRGVGSWWYTNQDYDEE